MWIDSHCHLNHERFEGADPAVLVQEAAAQGISGMVSVCCRIHNEFPEILKIAQAQKNVWCSIGTHPHDAGLETEQAVTLEKLVDLARSHPKIIGIGESGLDYYYDHSPREAQEQSFRKHIRACVETGLPLIVHARDADEDIASILKEEGAGTNLKGVMHCFSSSRALAEAALDLGFYISFSGIVTFKNAQDLQAIAKDIPEDRILVETDAPFLAPIPHRGQTNHPAYVRHTGEFLAALRGVAPEDFARKTSENFHRLFDRAEA
ncbi:MAG: TatD family hydrolase [Alphaproteobacteria bacterium]|nr:TatD family hydrolase [Alphaproteobacteria bacterium]